MWYIASAFFTSADSGSHQNRPALWEEVLLLIDAVDDESAARAAGEVARSTEHEYSVSQPTPHVLRWTFVKVERVNRIEGPLAHGTELFSRFLRATEAESLLRPFDDAEGVENS